jgi:hypothetical protein
MGKKSRVAEISEGCVGSGEKQVAGADGDVVAVGCTDGFDAASILLAILQVVVYQRGVVEKFDARCDADSVGIRESERLSR